MTSGGYGRRGRPAQTLSRAFSASRCCFSNSLSKADRNATQLAMIIGVLDYCTPCPRKTMVRSAAGGFSTLGIGFMASAASLRSRVNSGHRSCALAWLQYPASAIITRVGRCVLIKGFPCIDCHRSRDQIQPSNMADLRPRDSVRRLRGRHQTAKCEHRERPGSGFFTTPSRATTTVSRLIWRQCFGKLRGTSVLQGRGGDVIRGCTSSCARDHLLLLQELRLLLRLRWPRELRDRRGPGSKSAGSIPGAATASSSLFLDRLLRWRQYRRWLGF